MAEPRIAVVLVAEIRADRRALEQQAAVLVEALTSAPWRDGSPTLAVVAVALHHFYSAAESIFERIGRAFEGVPERSDRWHRDLLERMQIDLEGIRPAVLRGETTAALLPVLGFRHFFRHAYAVAFDPARLQTVANDALRAHELLGADLDALERALGAQRDDEGGAAR